MGLARIWMEGAHHPFEEKAEWYKSFLEEKGFAVSVGSLAEALAFEEGIPDLLVLGGLVYSGMGDAYQPLAREQLDALWTFLRQGGSVLAHHCVIGSFDDRPEVEAVWDGLWDWESSKHSPVEEFAVYPVVGSHPIVEGMREFRIVDELYYNLHYPKESTVVLEAEYEGRRWPLAWLREVDAGRIVFNGLGHDMNSLNNQGYQRFVESALGYLMPATVQR